MVTVADLLKDVWQEELGQYAKAGFEVQEQPSAFLGRLECLGFDTKKYYLTWPPRAHRDKEELNVGEMVADMVVPVGDSWYRHPDNIIFAHECIDVTALLNRAKYMFSSRRRLYELTVDAGFNNAKMQASAEGWLVPDAEGVAT